MYSFVVGSRSGRYDSATDAAVFTKKLCVLYATSAISVVPLFLPAADATIAQRTQRYFQRNFVSSVQPLCSL